MAINRTLFVADNTLMKNCIRMKKIIFSLLLFFTTAAAFAQQELLIQSSDKGFYITHTVQAKENFYSVGRLYNIAPKDMAAYNGLDMANGLNVGQQVRIPLTTANFTQSSTGTFPVYYKVGEKEGLYRVSLKNNNVLMASLRKWNQLTSDAIATGQKLIVGYITAPEAGAVVVSQPITPKQETEEVKTQPKPVEKPVAIREPEQEKPIKTAPATQQTAVKDANGGYFKSAFDHQSKSMNANKEETATASIFKTASGWQDTKYYALMDGVDPGTIVRVINPTNNKAIYAKVLGGMSGIRQNSGLGIRISNAAANVLEVTDTEKFVLKVNY
jgi:LysM repeat protein